MTEALKVFLSYASQNRTVVQELYNALKAESWIDPWLDRARILPGQDWQAVIEQAVEAADVVILCLSTQSINKEGFVQRELKYAYDFALEKPEETIFLIPVRLDDCQVPRGLRHLQRNDYFGAEKNIAYANLLDALQLRYQQRYGKNIEKRNRPQKDISDLAIAEEIPANAARHNSEDKSKYKRGPRAARPSVPRDVPTKTPVKSKPRPKKPRMDPSIMAAIIGVVGTILATLITLYATRPIPTPTPLPTNTATMTSTATQTLTPTETPTGTPVTLSPTAPTATLTFTPTASPVPLGEDWMAGCISTLWQAHPSTISPLDNGDGCWQEPLYVFSAENGDLDFLAQRGNGSTEVYGLFAPLPVSGTVSFTVRLRELTNVDLWMGVFAEPDIASAGLLLIIPNGDTRQRVIVHKDPHNYKSISTTQLLEQGPGFTISFVFNPLSATGRVDPGVFATNQYPIPTAQKWLFLGYKGLPDYYRIEGSFLQFELKP